ncbi:hypothetical protein BVY03_01305 [bacterium K02(2017)]|nr:hypothetical protein BVY03_01305 [bacterium K02(2017)]
MNIKKYLISFMVCMMLFSISEKVQSATINVPADYSTIQSAIDAANNGDEVLVAAGSHYGKIDFLGKDITVTSSNGAANTFIYGALNGPVVTLNGAEGTGATLNGFTISYGESAIGGGVFIGNDASPIISNNIILYNSASDGGGIGIDDGSPLIVNNIIGNNSASGTAAGGNNEGGGIYFYVSNPIYAGPQFINNTVVNNTAIFGSQVFADGFTNLSVFYNNSITGGTNEDLIDCSNSSEFPTIFDSNNVYSSLAFEYGLNCTDNTGINGNISIDPDFVSSFDFHLNLNSGLVDAGNNNASNLALTDLDGLNRVEDGDNDSMATVDIGAYEVQGIPNVAPTADAGVDQTVLESDSINLDGSLSVDSDGSIVSYVWTENGSQIATGSNPTVGPLSVGVHTITLTVTDNDGATGVDTVNITVNEIPNVGPTANAGTDQTVLDNETVNLNGSASSDSDGTIVSYIWTEGGSQIGSGVNAVVGPLSAGTHTIILTVTDDDGATDTDTVVITVNEAPNQAPIANAGPDQTVPKTGRNTSITLDGSASTDPDGTISQYDWYKIKRNGSLNYIGSGITFTKSYKKGTHNFTLIVTDNDGATDSDNVTVTITN